MAARPAWLRLFAAAGAVGLARSWRSECDIEGMRVEVTTHGLGAAAPPADGGDVRVCRAVFLGHEELREPPQELAGIDVIFTDSLSYAPFAGRRGPVHFLENVSAVAWPADLDAAMGQKTDLLSVLLPPVDAWDELSQAIFEQATAMIPDHIYIDDGTPEGQAKAFAKYRFSLIADDLGGRGISQPFIRSLGFHTIAVYNGFVELGAMVFNGVADFALPFDLAETLATIEKHNDHLGALWHYQRILQDQLQYRYNRPFEERLFSQACSLCRVLADAGDVGGAEPPLVFVGIYSARRNFEKRAAVRATWGRWLLEAHGLRSHFFIGEASPGASLDQRRIRREAEEYGDLVFLDVSEGYRRNSRKGLLFLEWIALRSGAQFLLKVDDDVYFRPAPLLQQLLSRPAAQYVWGYFDYISPVPREEDDHFYNTPDDFPFEVFPPYPRGVARVLSMDVVRMIAEASREGRLRMIYGDDPCIGVHLRQLLFESEEPLPSLTLDDFNNGVFAMEPSCHPNLWSKMTNKTWVIHHVSAEQIRCMWGLDVQAGYYTEAPQGVRHDPTTALDGFPDLCHCAPESSFEERTDLDNLRSETDRILFD